MGIEICEVKTNANLKTFVKFPFTLYKNNPFWAPALIADELNTLRKDKNPAFEACCARYWLAYDGKRVVGRIAAILNRPHNEKWGQRYLRFGWVDFVDDQEVSRALLDTVEGWARDEELEAVHGPLGFTNLDHAGMLVEGFNELGTQATIYNHAYYPEHMKNAGYVKDID